MKEFRISIATGLLAAAVAVWLAGCSSYSPGLTSNGPPEEAETRPGLLSEVVVTTPAPEPPVMDTMIVTATRKTASGTAANDEPGRSEEAVVGAGSGSTAAGRKPAAGHARDIQPGMTNPSFPFCPQHLEP